ncbi:MAG: succinate dehydrogenase [Synechococcaceae cyanobacterium]|nr:succinate dehydrogenase [Synechococcaceae cyanobacterium]
MIAISGLLLVLFLVLHLAGVSLALLDPAGFEAWATRLHHQPWLPPLELALALALLLHPLLSLGRAVRHTAARGPIGGARVSRRRGPVEAVVARAGRWLPFSGALLLLFLAVHLGQLRWHRPPAGGELATLQAVLASPPSLALYAAAGVALALHLLHGLESAHRSLGVLEPANAAAIRVAGRGLAVLLGGGFTLLALALAWRGAL